MTKSPCKGENCKFYEEYQSDVDKYSAVCCHPNFDEHTHSIKFGPCPGFIQVEEEDNEESE